MDNIWGSNPKDINANEFCPWCEREVPFHYESCPTRVRKPFPTYSPACICTHEYDESGRFPIWRITKYERECLAHGYMFRINLAADLRYGD